VEHVCQIPAYSDELSFDVSSSFFEDVSSSPPVEPSPPEQLVRHSHRLCRPPACYSLSAFTATTLSKPRPSDCYSLSAFTATALSELASYHDVILHPEWQHVMAEEIAALERIDTWDFVPCPPRVRPITCKWVYKLKTRSDGSLERYKARLVARDF
jgi:hypothetical protein